MYNYTWYAQARKEAIAKSVGVIFTSFSPGEGGTYRPWVIWFENGEEKLQPLNMGKWKVSFEAPDWHK